MDKKARIFCSKFDAVIFDLDGVVTQTARLHEAAWKDMFNDFLKNRWKTDPFTPFEEHEYFEYVDGKPRCDGIESFLASRGIELPYGNPNDKPDRDTVCGLGNYKNKLFQQMLKKQGVEVIKTSVDLIRQLRGKGFRTAVVSSSKNCARVLEAANITGLFDVKVDGVDREVMDLKGKPSPEIFLEAARRLDMDPARCVLFEDALVGVEAGKRGGFGLVIGVNRGDEAAALKSAGAHNVISDLAEVELTVNIPDLPPFQEILRKFEQQMEDRQIVIFLDYDGTLTPIVSRPEDAVLSEDMRRVLKKLAEYCPVSIVSGRGLEDVKQRVGIDNLCYAGSHGYEISGPDGLSMEVEAAKESLPILDKAQKQLERKLPGIKGAQVERKRYSIAIHYRNVEESQAGAVEQVVDEVLAGHIGLRKGYGKKVYELLPDMDWDKGRALLWLLENLGLNSRDVLPIYIGDDTTDENAFKVLSLRGWGLIVGSEDRETEANFRMENTEQVEEFFHLLIRFLKKQSAWLLSYEGFDKEEEGLREALCTLGNGYFATRGAAPESHADGIHYPGTYLAGGYNRLETTIAGRTIENEDLVNLPNWLCLDIRVEGGPWMDWRNVEILSWRQKLNILKGILSRELHYRDAEGRETLVQQRRMVSMDQINLAALKTVIVPLNWSGAVEVRSALDGRVTNSEVKRYQSLNNKHLEFIEQRLVDPHTVLLKMQTNQSNVTIAQAARVEVFVDGQPTHIKRELEEEDSWIAQKINIPATEGTEITIEKVMALYTDRDVAVSECGLEAVRTIADAGRFESLALAHSVVWKHLWRTFTIRLEVNGDGKEPNIQRILNLYNFHLLQTASVHSLEIDSGMPSRGWHGEAYRGHIFWDEMIIFPVLNFREPEITRTLLMYRYRRLNEARKAAHAMGCKGAMFPWQSGSDGREESQQLHLNPKSGRWIPDNSHLQRHINASIAYDVWQYYQVTGDIDFLSYFGAEMILEVARFLASIATYNEKLNQYEILGVLGPDEFHDAYPDARSPGLDNNAYTNIMTVYVLNRALEVLELLPDPECLRLCEKLGIEESEKERWVRVSRKMRVVFHDNGIISQFEGYDKLKEFDWERYRKNYDNIQRLDRILEAEGDTVNRYKASKQADVLMLFYLFSSEELIEMFEQLGCRFSPKQIPENIDYYLERTSNGSSLSWIIHSWVASRQDRKRSWSLFQQALLTDIADIQEGTTHEGIHLGAMAGCVDLVQRCYTGLEVRGNILRLNPQFPAELKSIHLHLRFRGHWLELDLSVDRLKMECLAGGAEPAEVEIKDRRYPLQAGESLEIDL